MLKFHDAFREAKSLDEMIGLHDDQYDLPLIFYQAASNSLAQSPENAKSLSPKAQRIAILIFY